MDIKLKLSKLIYHLVPWVLSIAASLFLLLAVPYLNTRWQTSETPGSSMIFYYTVFDVFYLFPSTVISVLGLLTGLIFRNGPGRGLFRRVPLELYLISIPFSFTFGMPLCDLFITISTHELSEDIFGIFGLYPSLELLFVLYGTLLTMLYWLFFQISAVAGAALRDGLRAYLYTHSFTIRLLRRVWRIVKDLIQQILHINWNMPVEKNLIKLFTVHFFIIAGLCFLWVFGIGIALLYCVLMLFQAQKVARSFLHNYQVLCHSAERMAQGNLSDPITEDLGLLNPLRDSMNAIRTGFESAVAQEVRSRNLKTELITNVSHDLKTPLTAIITYTDLLRDDTLSEETRQAYLATLAQKSNRLKRLIEDLFEISKAASGNVEIHRESVNLCVLVRQIQSELADVLERSNIDFRWQICDEQVQLFLDSQKTCRILENLLFNITKYGLAGTRAYISLHRTENFAEIIMKNISAHEITVEDNTLTERFVRGDASRSTEGSGLGLAIAKSFTELQGGSFSVLTDGDLFKVILRFPLESTASKSVSSSTNFPSDTTPDISLTQLQPLIP